MHTVIKLCLYKSTYFIHNTFFTHNTFF
ncbi:hypothetical protein DFW34_06500 [Clostridioides difficile]|nr:hypothetical protein [Clostridioides difficile]